MSTVPTFKLGDFGDFGEPLVVFGADLTGRGHRSGRFVAIVTLSSVIRAPLPSV
jgi:hypothetical protein